MQRRVAAIYVVFFLVMGASAYSVIALAEEPAVDLEGEPSGQGDAFTVNDREYVVANLNASAGGEGEEEGAEAIATLKWTNESARYTATLPNGSSVAPVRASFPGQGSFHTATLEAGDTVTFNGSEATVSIPDADSPSNFSLVRDGESVATFALNDTVSYRGNETAVAAVSSEAATLVWGDNYRVLVADESDPTSFRMVQQFNASARLAADPAVENETITRADGREYVVFTDNGSTRPLEEYLPDPDVGQLEEGDTMTVARNETTVANVTSTGVVVEWTAPRTNAVEIAEGENVTLNGQQFVVHFEGDSVVLSPQVEQYQRDLARQDYFHERQNGLWGVTLLSGIAAVFIVGLAYLPVRG